MSLSFPETASQTDEKSTEIQNQITHHQKREGIVDELRLV